MYSSQLKKLIDSDIQMKRVFCGIFPCDKLPKLNTSTDCALIINSGEAKTKGEHWLLVYYRKKTKTLIWFDSLGNPPNFYNPKILQWIKSNNVKIEINKKVIQSPYSYLCGIFVLFVFFYLSRGWPLSYIVNKFSRNLIANDRIVSNWVLAKFHFDVMKSI